MNPSNVNRYLETSVYTYAGAYKDFLRALPDDIPTIGRLVCGQITHPSLHYLEPSPYLEEKYFGDFSAYPKRRFKNEDELYMTAVAMIAGILRLDEAGFTEGRDVTKRLTVSCRQASILFSAILKAKGIPCRSRAGFMDFGDQGDSYMEHWVNEYWDARGQRWVLVDANGYYEYEERFGYSQFDLPRRKFVTAAEAWLGMRRGDWHKKLELYGEDPLQGVCEYLMMDFHALMNNEIFYSHQPLAMREGVGAMDGLMLQKLDRLAELLLDPDGNIKEIAALWEQDEDLFVLTNPTQNVYQDNFRQAVL